jgi:hypothetical protein
MLAKPKKFDHGFSARTAAILHIQASMPRTKAGTQRRGNGAKAPVATLFLASLQCYSRELRVFGKILPPLFSLFAPVQFLGLRPHWGACVFAIPALQSLSPKRCLQSVRIAQRRQLRFEAIHKNFFHLQSVQNRILPSQLPPPAPLPSKTPIHRFFPPWECAF